MAVKNKEELIETLKVLEEKINFTFKNKTLLLEAMLHSSFVNENLHLKVKSNERLEFLGDAVLDLVISKYLFLTLKNKNEGALSLKRSALVRESSLACIAKKIKLQNYLIVGNGEKKENGFMRDSVLSDTIEALFGAIYLDAGIDEAEKVILKLFDQMLNSINKLESSYNCKNQLQEYSQKNYKIIPSYILTSEKGPEHDRKFRMSIYLKDKYITFGTGSSKKKAEQKASKNALKLIKKKKLYFNKILANIE